MTIASEEAVLRAHRTRRGAAWVPALTGIRGYAALWVLIYHTAFFADGLWAGRYPALDRIPVVGAGYLGVDLFFLLSGFVLMRTYGADLARPDNRAVRSFAIGRAFRILPLHWSIMAGFLVIAPFMAGQWRDTIPHTATNFLLTALLIQIAFKQYTSWNGPAWSLSAEWLTYFAFPFIAVAVDRTCATRRSAMCVSIASLVFLAAVFLLLHRLLAEELVYTGLLRCLCEFVAGAALARAWRIATPSAQTGNMLLVVSIVLLVPAMIDRRWELLALPGVAALVAACATPSPYAAALFGNRTAFWLGEISFSLYLLHWLVLEVAQRTAALVHASAAATAAIIVGGALLTIPLARITWRWIELPGQAVGRMIVHRTRKPDPVTVVAPPARRPIKD